MVSSNKGFKVNEGLRRELENSVKEELGGFYSSRKSKM